VEIFNRNDKNSNEPMVDSSNHRIYTFKKSTGISANHSKVSFKLLDLDRVHEVDPIVKNNERDSDSVLFLRLSCD